MTSASMHLKFTQAISSTLTLNSETCQLKRACFAKAQIWNTDGLLNGVYARIEIFEQASANVAAVASEHGVEVVCGALSISEDAKAEYFESDGETSKIEGVLIYIYVNQFECDRIYSILNANLSDNFYTSATINFTNKLVSGRSWAFLEDLGLSTKSVYAILSYDIRVRHLNNRISSPIVKAEAKRIYFGFRANSVEVLTSVDGDGLTFSFIKLSCKADCRDLQINEDDVDLHIQEFPRGRWSGSYSDEGYSGEMHVWKNDAHTLIEPLLYTTASTLEKLVSLMLALSPGDVISLSVSVLWDGKSFAEHADQVLPVVSFSPYFSKSLAGKR